MRRLIFSFTTPLLIILVCVLSTCDNEHNQEELLIEYLSYNDVICPPSSLGKVLQNSDYLHDWHLDNNIIDLDFRFSNTCGRAYKDSVSILQDTVSITLTDTATVHARCICEHQCQFQFGVEGLDHIRLLLEIGVLTNDGFTYFPCVDTLLQW